MREIQKQAIKRMAEVQEQVYDADLTGINGASMEVKVSVLPSNKDVNVYCFKNTLVKDNTSLISFAWYEDNKLHPDPDIEDAVAKIYEFFNIKQS